MMRFIEDKNLVGFDILFLKFVLSRTYTYFKAKDAHTHTPREREREVAKEREFYWQRTVTLINHKT